MFKKEVELIKPIKQTFSDSFIGSHNNLTYCSLKRIFESFWYYSKKEIYLVGGCVRDLLLEKEPHDYDLCTNATPDEIKQLCNDLGLKYFDSGIKHGTLTIIDDFYHQQYEITTYRVDGKYSDSRHPDEVKFTPSLEEDLKRRDFTINSFAYNLLTNELVMLDESFNYDLKLGIIRTVGDANERFEEDALRMLRAIRFAAQLGFSIDKNTFEAIKSKGNLIQYISHERIRDELTKILLSDNPQMLEFICVTGLEGWYLWNGETWITKMLNCPHENPYHYTDVFHHTMDVIKKLPKSFILRWAAFFHDIGKPNVKELKPGTTNHYRYIGHPEASVEIADRMMGILKFSNEQKLLIHNFVLYHDYPLSKCSMKKFKQMLVIIGEDNFLGFIKLREADALAHKLEISTEFAIDAISKVKERYYQLITTPEPLRIKDLAINGDDLKEAGLKGKEIGIMLYQLLQEVLSQPKLNTKEYLIERVKRRKKDE